MIFRTLLLLLVVPCTAFAGISMGTGAVPLGAQGQVVQQGIAPPFANVQTTTTVDFTQKDCEPYSGKGPTPANPCSAPVEEIVTTVTTETQMPIMFNVETGSLRANVQRITRQAGWENSVWKMPYDFKWVGNVTITANDIQGALTKLLEPYPVQAVFYNANHVVAIVSRRNT